MHNLNSVDYLSVRAIQEVNREIESAGLTPSAWERIPPGVFPIPILVEMIKSGRPWQTATLEHAQWRIDIQLRKFMWTFKAYTSAFVFGFAAHLKPFEDLKAEFDAACGVARGTILRQFDELRDDITGLVTRNDTAAIIKLVGDLGGVLRASIRLIDPVRVLVTRARDTVQLVATATHVCRCECKPHCKCGEAKFLIFRANLTEGCTCRDREMDR